MDTGRASDLDTDRLAPIEIPEAPVRPMTPIAGPFFDVTDVRITGISDDPVRGLELHALREVAMAGIARQAAEQEIEEQGFSNEELREIARFLERVRGRDDETQVTKVALFDELVDLIDELDGRRGISVFDLEAVAREVQDEIRATGLLLAQVVVPPQTVRGGVVELRVYPGVLGQVEVVNNEIYKAPGLTQAFSDVTGKTVKVEEIEERLRLVNDLGGLDISGVFVPGRNPGETQLDLNVSNERRWSAFTRLDNHGADVTGRTRGMIGATIYDPTGAADQLALQFLRSEGPNEVTLYNARYQRPVLGLRNFVELGASSNEFAIGDGQQRIEGETRNYDLLFGTHWLRSRERNLSQTVHLTFKDSKLDLGGAADQDQEILEVGTTLRYDMLIPDWRMIIDGSTGLRVGSLTSGRIEGQPLPAPAAGTFSGQDKQFYLFTQTARIYKLFELPIPFSPGWESRHSLLFRLNSQYSDQFLPAVNRFSLGGAEAVRNLLTDDISVDKAAFASLQVYWELPEALDFDMGFANQRFSEFFRPYVFYDYAYGVTNAQNINLATQEDRWFEFRGYGLGFEYNLFKNPRGNYLLRGSVSVAWPENLSFQDPVFATFIDDKRRVYMDLTFDFDMSTFRSRNSR
ncbi:MAG: ShlB/FhaC/HecB family hemolysin secretion/activation protein [Gammaproteobacteria bacterium]|nr:ShlB/FhaC/HecB family hemolysin secretion/activation protein [Gammaproteobacteria bacterium]